MEVEQKVDESVRQLTHIVKVLVNNILNYSN